MKSKIEIASIIEGVLTNFSDVISWQKLNQEYQSLIALLQNDKFSHKRDCKKIQSKLMELANIYMSIKKPKPSEQMFMSKIQTICN
ncbi:MAG: hypothetical protein WCK02_14625 [Bacteroidota bacterium]